MSPFAPPIAALAALLIWECLPVAADPSTAPATIAAAARVVPQDTPPVTAWSEIVLARPLFALDRRPAPGAAGAQDGLPRLAGTIRSDADVLAIFAAPGATVEGAAKTLVVGRSGSVAGWTVAAIEDGAVTLERGARSAIVRVSFTNLAVAAVPAAAAAPPPGPNMVLMHEKRTSPFLQW